MGLIMRRVKYSEYVKRTREPTKPGEPYKPIAYWQLEEQGEATFHQWGCNYEEFETGAGNFSTAIIELDDGVIKNIPAEHIRFI